MQLRDRWQLWTNRGRADRATQQAMSVVVTLNERIVSQTPCNSPHNTRRRADAVVLLRRGKFGRSRLPSSNHFSIRTPKISPGFLRCNSARPLLPGEDSVADSHGAPCPAYYSKSKSSDYFLIYRQEDLERHSCILSAVAAISQLSCQAWLKLFFPCLRQAEKFGVEVSAKQP